MEEKMRKRRERGGGGGEEQQALRARKGWYPGVSPQTLPYFQPDPGCAVGSVYTDASVACGATRPFKATCKPGQCAGAARGSGARARRRGKASLWCLEIKAANLGLFLPFTLRHFYWRDEGRQSGPTVLALLLEVNDPVSSPWLRFRHFADIKPCASAKYILFPGAHPTHLRLLCNATKKEWGVGRGRRAGWGGSGGEGDATLNIAALLKAYPCRCLFIAPVRARSGGTAEPAVQESCGVRSSAQAWLGRGREGRGGREGLG